MKIVSILCALLFFISIEGRETFLVFGGKTGWIGQKLIDILKAQGYNAIAAESRLENREAIEQEIAVINPDFIVNAAGVIGTPNVDWCEDHRQEVIRSNIIGALNLADIAYLHGIHMTNIGTGCIYNYDDAHPMYSGIGFTEEEAPNFADAFYCKTKIMLEKLFNTYPNVLNLRLRLPVAAEPHPRNLITKLIRYKKVVNIPNCLSVLEDLLPLISQMAIKNLTGVYNFVNPGVISHNELLDFYKKYVDPAFSYVNFTVEEQNQILKVKRCYNELDVSKLLKEFPNIPHVKVSVEKIMQNMSTLYAS